MMGRDATLHAMPVLLDDNSTESIKCEGVSSNDLNDLLKSKIDLSAKTCCVKTSFTRKPPTKMFRKAGVTSHSLHFDPFSVFDSMLNLPAGIKNFPEALVTFLHANMFLAKSIVTAYGARPLVYADYIASGRSLRCIEDAIRDHILPFYANTHTDTGLLGRLMTDLREGASGSGSTSSFHKLSSMMGIVDAVTRARELDDLSILPVVFISTAEHHSNILIWREIGAEVVTIPTEETGHISLSILEASLEKYKNRTFIIGSFSAASNIAPVLQPVLELTRLIHQYNGVALFDYACAGPYVDICMCPTGNEGDWIDGIMLSPHKFLGGPNTPGLLLVRKSLCVRDQPSIPGGGVVSWVNRSDHSYIGDIEAREEAGTPDILGAIRAGFVFYIKSLVTPAYIHKQQYNLAKRAMTALMHNENIEVLGPQNSQRLPVFSMHIKSPIKDKMLHHHFVSRLLTDLFGIQTRSGCSCAAPYYMELTKLSTDKEDLWRSAYLKSGFESIKFGFVRFNLSYTHTDAEVSYILRAVDWVASCGYKMIPAYKHDPTTSIWSPRKMDPPIVAATISSIQTRVKLDFLKIRESADAACKAVLIDSYNSGFATDGIQESVERILRTISDDAVMTLQWYANTNDIYLLMQKKSISAKSQKEERLSEHKSRQSSDFQTRISGLGGESRHSLSDTKENSAFNELNPKSRTRYNGFLIDKLARLFKTPSNNQAYQ
ncbi:hypothetical protein BASA50_000944 [Batrachochytrium salamandrivorans]|uniref:Aminotransferase class V domain-containing protein n=1 Tax=Batrachochytrium salamandrivorans TaxID=1357716 RepID=A0ABQ8ETS7_9FUNG|nr:hypothetical protein BASA62_000980 [Batrachochytrium salamandrivorans]KAH6582262.1 hypothetical protein BASA60_002024 [Batrachochytrium salamandrivorans]KAH6586001.1 hypothetical protein BASA50_000944 [Batrachochytrium salamandrivorans]